MLLVLAAVGLFAVWRVARGSKGAASQSPQKQKLHNTPSFASGDRINLWDDLLVPSYRILSDSDESYITTFFPSRMLPSTVGVLVLPGGGYFARDDGSVTIISKWLQAQGFAAVLLHYRLPKGNPQVVTDDVFRALDVMRDRWGFARPGVLGFHSGGHLAALLATRFHQCKPLPGSWFAVNTDDVPHRCCLRWAATLNAPMTMNEQKGANLFIRGALFTLVPRPADIPLWSVEEQVRVESAPLFVAHSLGERGIPVEQLRLVRDALKKATGKDEGPHLVREYNEADWDEGWRRDLLSWSKDF